MLNVKINIFVCGWQNLYKVFWCAQITTGPLQDMMVPPPKIYWTDYTENFQGKMKWCVVKLSLCMPWMNKGVRGMTPLIHNLCWSRRWVGTFMSQLLFPQGKTLEEWAPEPIWMLWRRKKSLLPPANRTIILWSSSVESIYYADYINAALYNMNTYKYRNRVCAIQWQ
jgi:hypothetical protein